MRHVNKAGALLVLSCAILSFGSVMSASCDVTKVNDAVVYQCTFTNSQGLNYKKYIDDDVNSYLSSNGYQTVSTSTHVWIEAYGGQGAEGNGHDCVHLSGSGGAEGYANTVRRSGDLNETVFHFYVGSSGYFAGSTCAGSSGAGSTLVLLNQLSSSSFDFLKDTVLIAGGGGGGSSQCDIPSVTGQDGGNGGVAIAGRNTSSAVSGAGGNGNGRGGKGGNSNLSLDGNPIGGDGYHASPGSAGVGGYSGTTRHASSEGWVNVENVDSAAAAWILGRGGNSDTNDMSGASGAGGYGGGGGGSYCSGTSGHPGGGGGGGSYASMSTIADTNIPDSYSGKKGGGANGKVVLSFVLN